MAKKRVKESLTIRVSLVPGSCRWCGCTYERPCANGCGWAERSQTLCTECVSLDRTMQTARGRRELAEFIHEYHFPYREGMIAAAARPSHRGRR